jgi:hypothetical protein
MSWHLADYRVRKLSSTGLTILKIKISSPVTGLEWPRGFQEVKVPMAQDDGKVISLTHRPPLPPGNTPGTHFC